MYAGNDLTDQAIDRYWLPKEKGSGLIAAPLLSTNTPTIIMQQKHRDQHRRLALFDTEGEAIATLLLSNEAIGYGYSRGRVTVEVHGSSLVIFELHFDHVIYVHGDSMNKAYPQLILHVIHGNDSIVEDLDYRVLALTLNRGLPHGDRVFRLSYNNRPSYSERYDKGLF